MDYLPKRRLGADFEEVERFADDARDRSTH